MYIQVLQTHSFDDVKNHLLKANQQHIVLLDVDDTLITPKANVFRYKDLNDQENKYQRLIDEIKENKNNLPNYIELISHWRSKRQSILVHPKWPHLIQQVKKNTKVFALTQVDTGSFGQISSMEEWRFNELMQMGIEFSQAFTSENASNQKRVLLEDHRGYAAFYKGIAMTGPFTKFETLHQLLAEMRTAPKIIFVDDRLEQVQDVGEWAHANKIEYLGITFRGVETLRGDIQDEIVRVQKEYLINKGIWLEDEEAEKIVQNSLFPTSQPK